MANDYASSAAAILQRVGGAENISSFSHCATRLRMQLVDRSKADNESLDSLPEVMGVVPQGTQGLQVIMGGGVANYYQAMLKQPGMNHFAGDDGGARSAATKKQYGGIRAKAGWVDYCFEFLSDTFRPILWALLGASLIITILVLLDTAKIQPFDQDLSDMAPGFVLMHAMWRSVFYFLPIMVGACAARKLGANEWVGAAIPAAFLTPNFLSLKENGAVYVMHGALTGREYETVKILGLPLILNDYSGQVLPPLIAAIGLFWVEKGLKRIIPEAIQMVFVPFISLLVMIPLTAFLLGPLGIGGGNLIASAFIGIYNFNPFILAIVIPLLYPFLVPLGLHWPINAIMLQNIATYGYDVIQGPMGAWNFACFGLATGVLVVSIKERNAAMRQVATGGVAAGLLGGISEPSLYGIVLRFKKTYLRLLPGCFAGGVVMGIFKVKAHTFVFTSLLTIGSMTPIIGYAIGLAVAFFTSFFLVVFFDYRSKEEKAEVRAKIAADATEDHGVELQLEKEPALVGATVAPAASATSAAGAPSSAVTTDATVVKEQVFSHTVGAPFSGHVVALEDVPDAAFASGAVGRGVAIEPTENTVVSPGDGTVVMTFPTGHAVGVKLDNGLEVLIHVGIDTVKLKGKCFEPKASKGDRVSAGDPLIEFDRTAIAAAGYSTITPVLVTNHKRLGKITPLVLSGDVASGQPIIEATSKSDTTSAS